MDEGQIGSAIVTGSAITLAIVVFAVYLGVKERKKYLQQQNELMRLENEKQKEVLRAVIRTEELERRRISADLHDAVGSKLSMMQLDLNKKRLLQGTATTGDMLELEERLDEVVSDIRSACFRLYPLRLATYGLNEMITQSLSKWNESAGINTDFRSTVPDEAFGSPEAKLNIFRVVEEVLNNIVKHAHCTRMAMEIKFDPENTVLAEIVHDGAPFSGAGPAGTGQQGIGLASIRSRLNLLKGSISYLAGETTQKVQIRVPVHNG